MKCSPAVSFGQPAYGQYSNATGQPAYGQPYGQPSYYAPSGTASTLNKGASAAWGRGVPIPISSVRTGSVPGTHEFVFDAPFEQIRLEHVAQRRYELWCIDAQALRVHTRYDSDSRFRRETARPLNMPWVCGGR